MSSDATHADWCKRDCGGLWSCEVCDWSAPCLAHEDDCPGCEGARCGPCCDEAEREAMREVEEWAEDTQP